MTHASQVAVVALVLVACSGSERSDQWTTTVDTLPSGTIAVVNIPPDTDSEPTWVLEEELRIGSVNDTGPATFGQVRGLAVTDDGRIVVLESQTQEIRLFSEEGRHLVTFGRKGEGPGEFQNALGIMQTSAGLLYVPDERNARMTVLHPDSGFVRSYPLTLYRYGFVWTGVMRTDDHILVPSMILDTRRDLLRIYAADMTQVDTVVLPENPAVNREDPPNAFAWQAPGGSPRGFVQVPFYPAGASHLDRTGDYWSAPFGDPAYRIARWKPGGDTTLLLQTQRPNLPVTPDEKDSALNAILEGLKQYGVSTLDASKVPSVKPAVLSLFTDDEGRLWVQTASPDSLNRYDVYERNGRYAGTAVSSINVFRYVSPLVRGDRFYAVALDDMDVPYIVRARLTSAPQPNQ